MPQAAQRLESRPIDYERLWHDLAAHVRRLNADIDVRLRHATPVDVPFLQGRGNAFDEVLAAITSLRDAASGINP